MLQKKICVVGGPAVGKTSVVGRFVRSFFTDRYLSTIGVKIDKKDLRLRGVDLTLVLWDLAGTDEFERAARRFLRGASGYALVMDGTRAETVDTASGLQREVAGLLGDVPLVVIVNKADLRDEWQVGTGRVAELEARGWRVFQASAKTGEGVPEAFLALAEAMLDADEVSGRPSPNPG
jgi:small GTP-binding protein